MTLLLTLGKQYRWLKCVVDGFWFGFLYGNHCVFFRDGDKMAPSVEKKIAELEMGLLHLQQNIEIPEISLPIHATITNVAKQCYERGEKPKVTDFGEKAEDPLFLNQLQSGVNRWIREIQKVKKKKTTY